MSDLTEFRPVTPDHPCVICSKPDWCRRTMDGAHECHRINELAVAEFSRIAITDSNFAVYRLSYDLGRRRSEVGQSMTIVDFPTEQQKFRAAATIERKGLIAQDLGVSVAALESIDIGRANNDDLKRMRAGGADWKARYPISVSSVPEYDHNGALVGFCFRCDDGRKGAPSGKVGSKRGLIIPATLPTRPDPVLLVEGPTDVAACETLYIASVGRPSNSAGGAMIASLLARRNVIVVGENDRNPAGAWPGREGAEKLATYLATKWKRPAAWALPPEKHKDVRAYLKCLVAAGLDVNDEQACRAAGQRFLKELNDSSVTVSIPSSPSADTDEEAGSREILLQLCRDAGDFLFHDNENRAYAVVRGGGAVRTLPVKSREYSLLVGHRYYCHTGAGLPSTAKLEAIATLEGIALFDGPEEQVFLRVGEFEDKIVLDLCDDRWRVVIISKDGWEVANESPIRFRRTRGMLSLPIPTCGGSINDLRSLLNTGTEANFVLICAFIIGCFHPNGPFLILLINGEAGSAKSTLSRLCRALIDPNKAPLRSEPKDNRDVAIVSNNAWMVALDNMSHINERLSNALCRLATGGGFSTRELYTDSEEALFDSKRPVLINGIGEIADRSDLIDRAVRVTLPTIPEHLRRTERKIWKEFEVKHPAILGAFLDAVCAALRNQDSVQFEKLPRMADIAQWVVAAEPACPWPAGTFVAALDEHRRDADDLVVEASPLANAVREWIEKNGDLAGTATELLERLSENRSDKVLKHPAWPKSASAFGTRLREVAPNLRRMNINVEYPRSGSRRTITIKRNVIPPETLSLPLSPSSEPAIPSSDSPDEDFGVAWDDGDTLSDDSDPEVGDGEDNIWKNVE